MKTKTELKITAKIRRWLILFIVFLALSGITAFPLEWELSLLTRLFDQSAGMIGFWAHLVYDAVREINAEYPFIAYGTDWLAFAHLVIATAFIGPLRDPVRNIWVIQFGMIACVMVFPLAFICGHIRHIPFFWQLVDCSFGVLGIIPLYFCYKNIRKLELIENQLI